MTQLTTNQQLNMSLNDIIKHNTLTKNQYLNMKLDDVIDNLMYYDKDFLKEIENDLNYELQQYFL